MDAGQTATQAHFGRDGGLALKKVSLQATVGTHLPAAYSDEALAWRRLRRAAVTLVNARRTKLRGCRAARALQAATSRWATARDEMPSGTQEARSGLCLDEISGALPWGELPSPAVMAALQAVEHSAKTTHVESARAAASGWRDYVSRLLRTGGRKAFALIRGARTVAPDPTVADQPVVGAGAVEAALGTWLPMWWKAGHVAATDERRRAAAALTPDERMPRPSVDALDAVLGTYGDHIGLGADQLHPRSLLYLPRPFRVRFLDLLMAWEAAGSMPQDWAHKMVQLEKPDGSGHRTIGLTVSPLRVWSRLRSCYARKWEDENPCEAFWGAAGRPCERAA